MPLDDPVLLKIFPGVAAAEIAASRLRANGIECLIKTDDAGGMLPPLQTQEGVKLYVPRNQRDEAVALLETAGPVPLETSVMTEVPNENQSQKIRSPADVLPLLVAFLIGILATVTWQHFHGKRSGLAQSDLNHDGVPDYVKVWRDGELVELREDRNFDGKMDHWYYYENGHLVRGESDRNFDGNVDEWSTYTNGYFSDGKRDTDFNGVPDAFDHADNPTQVTTDWRPNGTNVTLRRQIYRYGLLTEEFLDPKGRGSFEFNIHYDAFQNPISTNLLIRETIK